jgi:hypothetical protein
MDIVANEPVQLNSEELELVVDMLDREQARLHFEMRHTDKRAYREEMKHRLVVVESLLGRLRKN